MTRRTRIVEIASIGKKTMPESNEIESEFNSANFRIGRLADQRNAAMDQVVLLHERIEQLNLELRKSYAKIAELLPKQGEYEVVEEAKDNEVIQSEEEADPT